MASGFIRRGAFELLTLDGRASRAAFSKVILDLIAGAEQILFSLRVLTSTFPFTKHCTKPRAAAWSPNVLAGSEYLAILLH